MRNYLPCWSSSSSPKSAGMFPSNHAMWGHRSLKSLRMEATFTFRKLLQPVAGAISRILDRFCHFDACCILSVTFETNYQVVGRSSSAGSSLYGSILNARARPDAPSPAASLTVDGVHLDVSVGFFYTDEASDVCDGGESGPPCSFVYPDGAVVHASPARALGQKPAFHPISPQSAITAGSSTSTMLRHGPYVMTAPDAHGRPAVAAAPADGMKRCKSGSVSRSTSSASSASTRRGDDDDSAPRVGCTGGLRDGLSRIVPGLRSGRATPTSGPLSPAPSSSPPSTPQRPLHANQQLWGERGIREEGGLWDDGAGNALVGPAARGLPCGGGVRAPGGGLATPQRSLGYAS